MEKTLTKTTWTIDPSHSEIQFKVRHLVISTVTGQFNSFRATAETFGADFDGANISFEADIDSISTNNEQRDGHLKSADFFDAENHPKLIFTSKEVKHVSEGAYELKGDLSIRGNSHPITLKATYGGTMVDPYGQTKAGFEINGKISREAFGLTWSATTEAGGVVVGDEVRLVLNIQMAKQ
jgi:polyisoprenoid-binding protein YceI